jgi:formiminotetrahydrofolate cyclodeaminase
MLQDKIQVAARIPKELHDACTTKYGNITNAIVTGLNLSLLEATENNCLTNENVISDLELEINSNKITIQELQEQIKILTIKDTDFRERIEEKNQYIESLKKELEFNQETHRNYMMQVQTLIKQKAIETKKPFWKFW